MYLDNCTKITDRGVGFLSGLENLGELPLSGCLGLTDDALKTVAGLKTLRYLVIENCPGLTREQIEKLETALPDCDIVRD
ncbi:MAG: hypothetical protein VX768_00115 [Planctomycetota bacterium]|nr:hypothetical protein [Planctomycetota bacterium]